MTASPAESEDSTRTRLLEGALVCMRRSGSTKLSFTEVSRAAGIARQTVYAYFPDRDHLLNETVAYAAVRLSRQVAEETDGIADLADALVEIIVSYHRAAQDDVAIAQVIRSEEHTSELQSH